MIDFRLGVLKYHNLLKFTAKDSDIVGGAVYENWAFTLWGLNLEVQLTSYFLNIDLSKRAFLWFHKITRAFLEESFERTVLAGKRGEVVPSTPSWYGIQTESHDFLDPFLMCPLL